MKEELDEMLWCEVIEHSNSPWASQMVLVKKMGHYGSVSIIDD